MEIKRTKKKLIGLALVALFIGGCEPFTTTTLLSTLGTTAVVANKTTDVMLTRASLELRKEELQLKRRQCRLAEDKFEWEKDLMVLENEK